MTTVVEKADLFFTEGASDKVYHVHLIQSPEGWTVDCYYGRRGSTLNLARKTAKPVTEAEARKIFGKAVNEKTSKGYTPMSSGVAFAGTENAGRKTGFVPQLLNVVEADGIEALINSPDWIAQRKEDGNRFGLGRTGGKLWGSNRKGLEVPIPAEVAEVVQGVFRTGDFELDGELIGGRYVVFDLLKLNGQDLRGQRYDRRFQLLQHATAGYMGMVLQPVLSAAAPAGKRALIETVRAQNGEGVVFKRADAPYHGGRPASGGSQLKWKFYETASVLILGINGDRRSARMALLNRSGEQVEVGNVTLPPNADLPKAGDVAEVKYLYAYPGGALYQPSWLGVRTDIDASECVLSQLKFKAEAEAGLEVEP